MSWPPPELAAGRRRRQAPDLTAQSMVRLLVLFVAVTAVAIAVAGGFRALFLL